MPPLSIVCAPRSLATALPENYSGRNRDEARVGSGFPTVEDQMISRLDQTAEAAERSRQVQEEVDRRKSLAELERQKRFLREAGQR